MDTTPEGLGGALLEIAGEYFAAVEEAAEADVRAAAKAALDEVRSASPKRAGKSGGKYARGWVMEPDSEDAGAKAYRIHNKAKPGLTHLLEKGHGGPHPAGAHPHIAAAAQVGIDELQRRIHG